MRRWLLVAVVAGIGCKSSDKKAAPTGTTDAAAPPSVFQRDAGMLPPPAPELVTLAGSYDISFELPKKYRCKDEAAKLPTKQTFDVSIDRTFGDMLVVTGVDGGWEDNGVENEEGNLSLHLRLPVHYVEQVFNLHVDGTQVTGTLSTNPTEVDVKPSCTPWLAGVKVSGTRTPPP